MVLLMDAMQKKKVGSVGAVGGASFDAANNRIKGIFTNVAHGKGDLNAMFGKVQEAERQNPNASRTTFRAFVRREIVEQIRTESAALAGIERGITADAHLRQDGTTGSILNAVRRNGGYSYSIEAVIPTNGTVSGCDLVYFGRNTEERTPNTEIRAAEAQLLESAQQAAVVSAQSAYARLENGGYRIEMLAGDVNDQDLQAMLRLYKEAYQLYTFPINADTIRIMLGNGNLTYVARGTDGQIASMLIAEQAMLQLDDGSTVGLYELSDFATFKAHRGSGLITALQIYAVNDLRSMDRHAIAYAEDRAPWGAVNRSSMQAGLSYSGTLNFHCTIISDRDFSYSSFHESRHETYETLNVWAAPPAPRE